MFWRGISQVNGLFSMSSAVESVVGCESVWMKCGAYGHERTFWEGRSLRALCARWLASVSGG